MDDNIAPLQYVLAIYYSHLCLLFHCCEYDLNSTIKSIELHSLTTSICSYEPYSILTLFAPEDLSLTENLDLPCISPSTNTPPF